MNALDPLGFPEFIPYALALRVRTTPSATLNGFRFEVVTVHFARGRFPGSPPCPLRKQALGSGPRQPAVPLHPSCAGGRTDWPDVSLVRVHSAAVLGRADRFRPHLPRGREGSRGRRRSVFVQRGRVRRIPALPALLSAPRLLARPTACRFRLEACRRNRTGRGE